MYLTPLSTIFFFFSSRRRHTRWTGDWSSDVCSSDLTRGHLGPGAAGRPRAGGRMTRYFRAAFIQIGRAACRERVEMSVGAVLFKKKKVMVKDIIECEIIAVHGQNEG